LGGYRKGRLSFLDLETNIHRVWLFDDWAEHYDQSVQDDGGFPFDGYEQVLDEITRAAGAQGGMKVLDLGVGTGNLATRFAALGCDIWGIDFSAEMLAKAIEKLPQAVLVQADLLSDWPRELDYRFDRIVSAYLLHEFDLSTKVKLLRGLTERHLAVKGCIVVGDIAFPTSGARDQARRKWADLWDEEEYYWAADEVADTCERVGLQVTYKQVSSCGGVFVITPIGSG
jgi:putative AdoMet-dependent methyltransferase